MKRIRVRTSIVAMVLMGCIGVVLLASERRGQVPVEQIPPGDLSHIIDILGGRGELEWIPHKYECGEWFVTEVEAKDEVTLTLNPGGVPLLQAPIGLYDVTFTDNCDTVIYATGLTNTLSFLSLASRGTDTTVSFNRTSFPESLIVSVDGEDYYPALAFLYSIDSNRLLLSFDTFTTGRDVATNQAAQAVYDRRTGALTFLSLGGGPGPVFLDTDKQLLVVPDSYVADTPKTLTMTNLLDGSSRRVQVEGEFQYVLPCDPNGFDSHKDYRFCRFQRVLRLLPPDVR